MGRISGGRHGRGQDGSDLLIVDHFPQTVGADQQDVVGSQRESRRLHFHGGFLAQTAIELIAAGGAIDLVRVGCGFYPFFLFFFVSALITACAVLFFFIWFIRVPFLHSPF